MTLTHAVRDALRRAILTLGAMPVQIGPQFPANCLANRIVRESIEAYGYTPERLRFQPTPRDVSIYLDVLWWITWYEHQVSEKKAQVFWAWSHGKSQEFISRKYQVSRQAVHQWLNEVVDSIIERFPDDTKRICTQPLDTLDAEAILHANVADCVADDSPLRNLPYVRAADSVPTREAAHIEGSQAQADRERTIRKLTRNARKWEKIKQRRRVSGSAGS